MIDVSEFAVATGLDAPLIRAQMQDIVEEISELSGVPVAEIMSRRRGVWQISRSRQYAMWLIRKRMGLSYPEIGRFFRRDHTTVIHAVRAVNRRLYDARSA